MMVVVPPQAAALVPVSKVSAENVPPKGISMWVWASMPPGMTYLPVASNTASKTSSGRWSVPDVKKPGAATAAIVSPSTSTSAGVAPVELRTVPFVISVRIAGSPSSRRDERVVGVGPAVAVERPQVAHLGQQAHVEIADDDLVVGVGGGLTHELSTRIGEVGLSVEVVVAQRFHAHAVDRADEVLVGDRRRGLFQPPQVLRQAAARGGGVEHDPRTR